MPLLFLKGKTPQTTMSMTIIRPSTFKHIVNKLEDSATILDTKLSISLDPSALIGSSESCNGFTISLPLRNGRIEVVLDTESGSVKYYGKDSVLIEEWELDYEGSIALSFDSVFRAALLLDKKAPENSDHPTLESLVNSTNHTGQLLNSY